MGLLRRYFEKFIRQQQGIEREERHAERERVKEGLQF